MLGSSLLIFVLKGFYVLFVLFVSIYIYCCLTRFTHRMMFVSYNRNIPGTTLVIGTGTAYAPGAHEFTSCLRGYHTLQGDNSLKSVERFDHMMFVYRFQAFR
jgi:hypothetical protein